MIAANNTTFRIEGDDRLFLRRGSGIEDLTSSNNEEYGKNFSDSGVVDGEATWRDLLNTGSNRYSTFNNFITGQKLTQAEIAAYLGTTPAGTLPTRAEELAGNVAGLDSGSAKTTAALQASGVLGKDQNIQTAEGRAAAYGNNEQSTQNAQNPPVDLKAAFGEALNQTYVSRPDLQKIYRGDGSRINPNDGNPATLMDWARTFGVNESPQLKAAYEAMQRPATNTPASPQGGSASGQVQGSSTDQTTGNTATGGAGSQNTQTGPGSFEKIYSDVYKKLGLNNIKDQYNDYNKQLLDLRNQKDDEAMEINDNPWYTEGKRVAELGKLDEKYERRLGNLQNFLILTDNMYKDGVQQAQFLTTGVWEENETQRLEAKAATEAKIAAAEKIVEEYGVTTPWFNKNGTFFRSTDGKGYSSPDQFFKDAGVKSFEEAYAKGLVTNIDPGNLFEKAQIMDLASKYPDAGIRYGMTLDEAMNRLGTSNLYLKDAGFTDGDPTLGGLTEQQVAILNNVQSNIRQDQDIKDFIPIRDGYERVTSGVNQNSGVGDLAIIYGYMKILDPTSVVREGEFATAENSGGVGERVRNLYNKVISGERLSAEQRTEFASSARNLYETKKVNYDSAVNFYGNQLDTFNIPRQLGIRDLSSTVGQEVTKTPIMGPLSPNAHPLVKKYPFQETQVLINQYPNATEEEVKEVLGFSQVGNTTASRGNTAYLKTLGGITSYGSPAWSYGLDVDLKIGDPVKSPVTGKVLSSAFEKGWGNTVRIQDASGKVWRLSHLDKLSLKPGQTVATGQLVGLGGNTGTVIKGKGGDGSHLDVTVYVNGKPISAQSVKSLLDKVYV